MKNEEIIEKDKLENDHLVVVVDGVEDELNDVKDVELAVLRRCNIFRISSFASFLLQLYPTPADVGPASTTSQTTAAAGPGPAPAAATSVSERRESAPG